MFEKKLTALLQQYLGEYVCGLDSEALKLSIWSGNIVLKNLKLKPGALRFLGIPGLEVKAGLLGSLTLQIPWNKLGSLPVIVSLDRIYVLASLDASGKSNLHEDSDEAEEASDGAKRRRIDGAVAQMVAKSESSEKGEAKEGDGGYVGRMIQTILGNLQVIISNLHVRVEDPYWGFAINFTVEELSGITVNEKGEPDFASSGLKEELRKRFKLRKLILYIDPQSKELTSETPWEELNILDWDNLFLPHIKGENAGLQETFFLKPVNADLLYLRKHAKKNEGRELMQNASLTFQDLGISATQNQYVTIQRMLQTFEVVSARAPYSHLRPHCTVKTSPRAWWVYALNAMASSDLVRRKITITNLLGWNAKRKDYVKAYLEFLNQQEDESEESQGPDPCIAELEEVLHEKTVVFFRCLALAEHKRRHLERKRSMKGSGGWFFGWGGSSQGSANVSTSDGGDSPQEGDTNFDQTDWQKLESIYMKDDDDDGSGNGKTGVMGGDLNIEVNVESTSLVLSQTIEREVLRGNIKQVRVEGTYTKEGQLHVTSSVGSYLLESKGFEIMKNGQAGPASDAKAFTLTIEQTSTFDLNLTHIQANISPCFVEVYKPCIEDIIVYFSAHDKGSRLTTLGMQAAATAQEFGKNTAEQLQVAIASRPSVTFGLDIQAPKIAVVWDQASAPSFSAASATKTLVVNLGRIILSSEDAKDDTVWQRVRATLSETEVYLAQGELQWKSVDIHNFTDCASLDLPKSALLPKFGMQALFQYSDLSASESSLSLDLHVPDFSLHFSPMVVCDGLTLAQYYATLATLVGEGEPGWDTAELADTVQIAISTEGPAHAHHDSIISPRRKQSLTMNWIHRCRIYLKDDVLYADIPGNVGPSRSIFLGRASQILAVPSRFVDDRANVIIVTESEDRLKQALNLDNSIVISFDNEEKKALWLQNLQFRNEHLKTFAHKKSEFNDNFLSQSQPEVQQKTISVHIHGKLDIFHLFVQGRSNPYHEGYSVETSSSFDPKKETELIQVNATGVSVEMATSGEGMQLQMVLNTLFVEDLLVGRDKPQCRFIIKSEPEEVDDPQSAQDTPPPCAEELGMIDQEGDVFYDPDESTPVGSPSPTQAIPAPAASQQRLSNSLAIIKFSVAPPPPPQGQSVGVQGQGEGGKTELDINLSQISVYVNRPTIAALMVIGQDIGYFLSQGDSSEATDSAAGPGSEDVEKTEVLSLQGNSSGSPEAAGSFVLKLHMKEAKFVLNYVYVERPLALLKVESLALDINLAGESFLLEASLGNLKVADCSVDSAHMYHWAVDVYQGDSGSQSGSLVDLKLGSVKSDGSDLCPNLFIDAHMKSISVVFLNRFLMEILLYIENLFKVQPEPLGSLPLVQPAALETKPLLMSLTISLDAPMIKLPRSTSSRDYLEVTPGGVKISNSFSIQKCGKDVYVDKMDVLLTGLKCTAYMDCRKGTDILDGTAITVVLSRPLNFAPGAENRVGVKVLSSELKGELSKMEYHFVISVAGENFSEEMWMPSFQVPEPKQEIVVEDQTAPGEGLTGVWVDVDIDAVDITLYTEDGMRSTLSRLQCKHLRTYLLFDFLDGSLDLSVSLPQLRVEDIRGANIDQHTIVLCSGSAQTLTALDSVSPSLLLLRFRSKGSSSELDLILQEPRIFGEIGFVMTILDFFVPAAIPEDVLQCVTIDAPEFRAEADVYLSPAMRICAAASGSDFFVFDGDGFKLVFPEEVVGLEKSPLIFVGPNKTLLIKNATIVNFYQMCDYTELMANARIEFENVTHEDAPSTMTRSPSLANLDEDMDMKLNIRATNFMLELRASTGDASLGAKGKVEASLHLAGKSQHLRSKVEDLCLFLQEQSTMKVKKEAEPDAAQAKSLSSITLLDPCTLGVEFVVEDSSDMIHVDVSNLSFRLSPMAIHFLLQLQEEIVTSLGRAPPEKPLIEVVSFTKLFSYQIFPGTFLTFWRPNCDSKYATLGDCISYGAEPPARNVSVVAKGYGLVKKPLRFDKVFSDDVAAIWHPIAPEGYVALGCVVTGASETPESASLEVYCVHRSTCVPTLTEEYFSPVCSNVSVVNVRNDFGTFIVLSSETECACLNAVIPAEIVERIPNPLPSPESQGMGEEQQKLYMDRKLSRLERETNKPYLRYTVHFKRILQNKRGHYSFWRPITPEGCYAFGDVAVMSLAPPSKVLCVHESAGDLISEPVKFSLVMMEGKLSIWKPIPPQGYVSLGLILSKGSESPPIHTICCIKSDHVKRPEVFNLVELKFSQENLYLFTFEEVEKTFVISDTKSMPSDCWTLDFKDDGNNQEEGKSLIVTTKCGNINLAIADSGQTPKFEVQLVDILVSMEGKEKKSNLMCTFGVSLSSFNSALLSWEPILEKTDFILKMKILSSKFDAVSLPGEFGIYLSPTSSIHITVAHACLESAICLLTEWSDMTKSGSLFMNQDLNCLNTIVTNETGSDFYFLLRYTNGTQKIEKVFCDLEKQEFLQPFNVPKHLKRGSLLDHDNDYLRVRIESLQGSLDTQANTFYTMNAVLQYNGEDMGSCLHTRPFDGVGAGDAEDRGGRKRESLDGSDFACNEMLLIPLSPKLKKVLLNHELREGEIVNLNLNLWQTRHVDLDTKKLVSSISYPILRESPHHIREENCFLPLAGGALGKNMLLVTFSLDLPLQKRRHSVRAAAESETFIGATKEGPWVPLSKIKPIAVSSKPSFSSLTASGTITPLRVGAGNIILESNLIAGRRLDRFRSNVRVHNASQRSFDVGVKKIIPTEFNVFEVESDHDPIDGKYFVSVFENQRFNVAEGWVVSNGKDKRSQYSTFYGKSLSVKGFPNLSLPLGWEWCGEWVPRKVPHLDQNGWCYFKNFASFQYPPPKSARSKGITDSVRSRCFIRYCKHTTLTDEEIAVISAENNSIIEIGTVGPQDQLVIPKKLCAVGSILELVWRPSDHLPSTGEKLYNWSVLISARSENVLSLGSMEETSQLMACAHNMLEGIEDETEPALFCVSSEGIELSSYCEIVTDWRISVAPAISIENCTSVGASVNIWENQKAKGMLPALKCKMPVSPHAVLENLKVDPRKLLSMTFTPEGWEWPRQESPVILEDRKGTKAENKPTKHVLHKDRSLLALQISRTRVYPKFSFPYSVKIWSQHCIVNLTRMPLAFCLVPLSTTAEPEELDTSSIRVIRADEWGDQRASASSSSSSPSAQRQIVLPGRTEVFSSLKGQDKCGLRLAVSESFFSVETIPLTPGGDIVLLKAFCPYSSVTFSVTISIQMHEKAPTTVVCCKPHLICSNLTGKELLISPGENRESSAKKVEIDGREVELHSTDKDRMKLSVKVDGYLWSPVFEVSYPNGINADLILESEDLQCARILSLKTKLESPGCLHVFFVSFNLANYSPPYSVVNFTAETITCRKAYDTGANWVEVSPYSSHIPSFTYSASSAGVSAGLASIEVKAKDAPARVYTLWNDASAGRDYSFEEEEDEASSDLQVEPKPGQSEVLSTRLHPLPINAFPGECSASLVRADARGVKLVIATIFKMEGSQDEDSAKRKKALVSPAHTEFKFDFSAEYVDISLVSSVPKELALLTVRGLQFSLCDGIGMRDEKIIVSLKVEEVEVDDMDDVTPYPAAIVCKKTGSAAKKPFLSLVLHKMKTNLQRNVHISYSEIHVGKPVEVEIFEKLIWDLLEFVQSISLDKLESGSNAYADPDMRMDVLSVAGLSAHISFQTAGQFRPKSLNVASKFGLNFANFERMPISILKRWEIRNLNVKQSVFNNVLASRISRDISKQILPILLSGISLNTVSPTLTLSECCSLSASSATATARS